jgi:preprotein translocase subunit SecE
LQAVTEFVKESWQELKKVTWPTRKEVINSALVVTFVAVLFMLVVYLEDMGIHWLLKLVY